MKTLIAIASIVCSCFCAEAQSNTTPANVIGYLQSYLLNNDTNYNGWDSNHFDLWEAAVFQNVNGTPGASAVGNVLGLEIPIHKYNLHVESLTDFETVFGNVGYQALGLGYDYNIHQIQLSAGLDVDVNLNGATTANAVPFIEFKKASTSLGGSSPFLRYEVPIRKSPGAGRFLVGLQVPF